MTDAVSQGQQPAQPNQQPQGQQPAQPNQQQQQQDLQQSMDVVNRIAAGNLTLDASDLPDNADTDTGLAAALQDQMFKDSGLTASPQEVAPVYTLRQPTPQRHNIPDGFQPSGSALHSGLDFMSVHNDEMPGSGYLPETDPVEHPGVFQFTEPAPVESDNAYVAGEADFAQAQSAWQAKQDQARVEHENKLSAHYSDAATRKAVAHQLQMDDQRKMQAVSRGWGAVRTTLEGQGITPEQLDQFLNTAHTAGPAGPDGKPTARIRESAHVIMQAIVSEGDRIVPALKELVSQPELADAIFNLPPAVAARKLGMLIGRAAGQTQQRASNTQRVQQAAAGQAGGYSLLGQ